MATAAAAMDATVACHVIALAPLGAGTPPPPDGTSLALELVVELVVELPEVVVFVYVESSFHMYESPTSPSPISSARTDADDASASVHRSAAEVQIFMVSDRAWGFLWGLTKSDELKGSVLEGSFSEVADV